MEGVRSPKSGGGTGVRGPFVVSWYWVRTSTTVSKVRVASWSDRGQLDPKFDGVPRSDLRSWSCGPGSGRVRLSPGSRWSGGRTEVPGFGERMEIYRSEIRTGVSLSVV